MTMPQAATNLEERQREMRERFAPAQVCEQPGVLKIGKSERRDGKRDYLSLRIPQSVAERVHEERSK